MTPKNLLIVGDVHGCLHTFQQLLAAHYNPVTDQLIQLGDLMNKGKHVPAVVELAQELQTRDGAIFLCGNHEQFNQRCLDKPDYPKYKSWERAFIEPTLMQYKRSSRSYKKDLAWLSALPVSWENEYIFASHAGISFHTEAYDPKSQNGLLWHRLPIRNIGKLQVVGHTPQADGRVRYDAVGNCYYIDTGAFQGLFLSAIYVSPTGEVLAIHQQLTDERDM